LKESKTESELENKTLNNKVNKIETKSISNVEIKYGSDDIPDQSN